ncbi:MAG TPA: Holliday junction resolvase Hjc [Candidatus Nanoarchaeia archaeon]|nr:Holliday junction resolvase Hjc [Candidatus Nanoarchaeia archaeon]
MNTKAKGSKGERELIKFFNENGWSAIRSAGSGSSRYPAPDILAGNALRRLAIECKVTKDHKKYFQSAEIEQLRTFSRMFGAEGWVGIKFGREQWYFLILEDLHDTGGHWMASLESAKRRGLTMLELMEKDR